jgi:hypothetical protein
MMGKAVMCVVVGVLLVAACGSSKKSSSSSSSSSSAAATTTTAKSNLTVTITPHTGLHDGETVQVVGKGFTAGQQYGVTECANKGASTGAGDCNLRGIKVGTADAAGTVTVAFPVAKGPFGSNNIVCTNPPGCIVSVANAGSANPTQVALGEISFAS